MDSYKFDDFDDIMQSADDFEYAEYELEEEEEEEEEEKYTKEDLKGVVKTRDNTAEMVQYDEDEDDDDEFGIHPTKPDTPVQKKGTLTLQENFDKLTEDIFSAILIKDDHFKDKLKAFKSTIKPEIFTEEDFMIAKVMHKGMTNKPLAVKYLRLMLKGQIPNIKKEFDGINLHLSNYDEVNGSKEQGFIEAVVKRYEIYLNNPDPFKEDTAHECLDEYLLNLDIIRGLYKEIAYLKLSQDLVQILGPGLVYNRHTYIGVEDYTRYAKRRMAEIGGLVDIEEGTGFETMQDYLNRQDPNEPPREKLCEWEGMPTLNEITKGIRRGFLYEFMAPPKGGKTKICSNLCYQAIMNGVNVTVWPVEGGKDAWVAQMQAIHCERYHNAGKTSSNKEFNMPSQGDILNNNLDERQKKLLEESTTDLRSNPAYGTLDIIDRPFLLETWQDEVETSVTSCNSKMVIIDYIQLISSSNPRKANHEVIKEAFIKIANYAHKLRTDNQGIAVLTPVQLKQEAVNEIAKSGHNASQDLRVAAAGSGEVIKSADYAFAILATEAELANGYMAIKPLPNRYAQATEEVPLKTELAYCRFVELPKK